MKQRAYYVRRKTLRGFSLVELLFAIFIVALGIVGVIITMNRLLQFQNASKGDQRAATALSDLTQRIRMIEMMTVLSSGAAPTTETFYTATVHDCLTAACSLTQLAQSSVHDWQTKRLPNILPGASGTVTPLGTPITHFRVTLKWPSTLEDNPSGVSYRSCTGVPSPALTDRCAQVVILP